MDFFTIVPDESIISFNIAKDAQNSHATFLMDGVKIQLALNVSFNITGHNRYDDCRLLLVVTVNDGLTEQYSFYSVAETEKMLKDLRRKAVLTWRSKTDLIALTTMIDSKVKNNAINIVVYAHDGFVRFRTPSRTAAGMQTSRTIAGFVSNGTLYYVKDDLSLPTRDVYTCPAICYNDGVDFNSIIKIDPVRGDFNQYCADVKNLLADVPNSQVIFAANFNGIILKLLDDSKKINVRELYSLFSISGKSGTGKTSMTVGLAESLFGECRYLRSNSSDTKVQDALIADGVCPTIYDDASSNTLATQQKINKAVEDVFNLASGQVRQTRYTKDRVKFYSQIMVSVEDTASYADLVAAYDDSNGAGRRLIELSAPDGQGYALDAKHADKAANLGVQYAGQVIPFIKYILENGLYGEKLYKLYDEHKDAMVALLYDSGLPDKYSNRIALYDLAASIANNVYNSPLDRNKVADILVKSCQRVEERYDPQKRVQSIAARLLSLALNHSELFAPNASVFDSNDNIGVMFSGYSEIWVKNTKMAFLMEDDTVDILNRNAPQNPHTYRKLYDTMAEEGLLQRRGDGTGYTVKKTMGAGNGQSFVFVLTIGNYMAQHNLTYNTDLEQFE